MIQTTLCYPERDGKYYMMHRIKKENDCNAGKWIGIGGHFEAGEDPFDCVKREAMEETGLSLTALRYVGIITFLNTKYEPEQMHLFHATDWEKVCETECDEGVLDWIGKKELLKLPLWEGDRIFLRLMDEHRPFFSLKLNYDGDELLSAFLDGKELLKGTDYD